MLLILLGPCLLNRAVTNIFVNYNASEMFHNKLRFNALIRLFGHLILSLIGRSTLW